MAKQPDPRAAKVYRGRRRLPKLPSRRYWTVVFSAFIAASVVALTASAVVPDDLTGEERGGLLAFSDALDRDYQASQGEDYGPPSRVDAAAPDVWLLPIPPVSVGGPADSLYGISSLFGSRWGRPHWGTDLRSPQGTRIYAVHSGTVQFVGFEADGFGNFVQIDHGGGVDIFYAHMRDRPRVTDGQHVEAGEWIGVVGTTGRSTGPHLHFEIRVHGGFYDAVKFMREHGVDLATRQEEANGGVVVVS